MSKIFDFKAFMSTSPRKCLTCGKDWEPKGDEKDKNITCGVCREKFNAMACPKAHEVYDGTE